jgi:transcriptional regulator with XRE-family HTH domain
MALTIPINELGQELSRRREESRLSLRELEELTGVSAATLSRIERGSVPDLEIASRLAKWLDVVIQTGATHRAGKDSDEDLKRTIEIHLRANKKLDPKLARSIAESFDFVMRLEMEKAAARKKR